MEALAAKAAIQVGQRTGFEYGLGDPVAEADREASLALLVPLPTGAISPLFFASSLGHLEDGKEGGDVALGVVAEQDACLLAFSPAPRIAARTASLS